MNIFKKDIEKTKLATKHTVADNTRGISASDVEILGDSVSVYGP